MTSTPNSTPDTNQGGNNTTNQGGGNTTPPVEDLGTVTFNSPSRDRRNQRRGSLVTAEALAAMRLSNEVIGDRGLGYPVDAVNRSLFTNPVSSPAGTGTNTTNTTNPPRTITIDGRTLTLKQSPNDKDSFTSPRLWDKEARAGLNAEEKKAFVDSATGYVLSKSSKLALVSTKTDDKGLLQHVHSLQLQLKQLKLHVENHDLIDVFTIVVPKDLQTTGELTKSPTGEIVVYDLFKDYSRLHRAVVANSNAWYNSWIHQDYVQENISYSFTMLQKNTEESLWQKCLAKD